MAAFDETFDFVVVGSGGGSMCCALALRTAGKSVAILEKTDLIGGTTARSGGVMWIPDNRFMKRDGVPDSTKQAITYLNALSGNTNDAPGTSAERRQIYVTQGKEMVDFLVAQGIKLNRVSYWPDYHDELPGSSEKGRTVVAELFNVNELGPWKAKLRPNFIPMMSTLDEMLKLRFIKKSWEAKRIAVRFGLRTIFAKLTGKHYVTAGAALQGRMFQATLKAGVEFRTESPVTELIVDGGKVVGVMTTKDGKPWRIGTRLGVLVNAGGFAKNQAMRDQYIPGTSTNWSLATEGDTGEMIREMQRHGAALGQMEEMVGNQIAIPPGMEEEPIKPVVQGVTAAPHCILVDQSGVRYMNEGGSYMAYCKGMLNRHQITPAVPSWAIMDQQFMDQSMLAGTMAGSTKPKSWFETGFLRKADSIEELAGQIAIDPVALRETVDRFNGFVVQGHDDDFNRGDRAYDRWLGDHFAPNASLGAIEKGPFFAMQVLPGDVGTYGGVVTDADARVLRDDGTVIEGLYATGVSTASSMGRSYPGAGASVGPSFVWGYVTAKHVLAHA
ncbi:FAD-dependent oxidoreductase [Novosphingobium sp. MMS21-SN21R]|uniref:FAD-dependent oxidoreductase n=1 Tax=Novosphingobium sp. MMS21-SN21R TaxID=2969298 RepID=UPI002884831D|nr:FAD-dependent oxidoreductase [Novosphingobium sp. MMS21-SN21R]MDT0509866.1 FAD-dependent oxidoreductase [Novosphingobium sp. MMS21-SN21R]